MNQYQYDHMTPYEYESCGAKCDACEEPYVPGCNDCWIEYEDITLNFCSPECKEYYKEQDDEDEIYVTEGP